MNYDSVQISATDLEDSGLPPILNEPVIAGLKMTSVEADSTGKKDEEGYEVISFNFVLVDGPRKGNIFRHRVFDFKPFDDSDDPQNDLRNWKSRLGYILRYFIGTENAEKIVNGSKNWAEMRANVVQAFEVIDGWKDRVVQGKIWGKVNRRNQAILEFPPYLGFLADDESTHKLEFNLKQKKSNAAYLALLAAEINAAGAAQLNGDGSNALVDVPEDGQMF